MSENTQTKQLEDQLKQAFTENQFERVAEISAQIIQIDPENRVSKKINEKIVKAKEATEKKANAEKISSWEKEVIKAFKDGQMVEMENKANGLLSLDPKNRVAKKHLKKVEKAKLKADPSSKKSVFAGLSKLFQPKDKSAQKAEVKEKKEEVPRAEAVKQVPVEKEVKKIEAVKAPGKEGNVFTKMFGEKESVPPVKQSKSIIDTIVDKSGKKKVDKKEKPKVGNGARLLKFSHLFLRFAVAFIVLSAAFFYVENIDTNNRVLGFAGLGENYASQLHSAAGELEDKQEEERQIQREINKFDRGYNNSYEQIIGQIVDDRLNWPDILRKINAVTDSVYERNAISQYVQYDNFSFDAEKGAIRVSGTLSDPLGKNLTKLAELEEAFLYFPKNKDNLEDTTDSYFRDVKEFNSLRKSFDKQTGKYKSSFQLTFSLDKATD